MKKLYVVVREDLDPGLVAAQAVHAALKLALKWSLAVDVWDARSGNLVLLGARNEAHLAELEAKTKELKLSGNLALPIADFHEIDLNGQLTGFACIVGEEAAQLFGSLPLAFKAHRQCILSREAAE